jgi:hypothetical protein
MHERDLEVAVRGRSHVPAEDDHGVALLHELLSVHLELLEVLV